MFEIKCDKNGTDIYVDGERLKRVISITFSATGREHPECWVEVLSEDSKNRYKVDLIHREMVK